MGRHSGSVEPTTTREMTQYAVGAVASFAVWVALVTFAIKLGGPAKNGSGGAWFLLIVAALGAVGCLALTLMLAARAWELRTDVRMPRRASGGGRRKR